MQSRGSHCLFQCKYFFLLRNKRGWKKGGYGNIQDEIRNLKQKRTHQLPQLTCSSARWNQFYRLLPKGKTPQGFWCHVGLWLWARVNGYLAEREKGLCCLMPASSIYVPLASIKNISVSFCLPACYCGICFLSIALQIALPYSLQQWELALASGRAEDEKPFHFSSTLSSCGATKVFDGLVVVKGWCTRPGLLLICSASIALAFSLGFKLNWWHCWDNIVL